MAEPSVLPPEPLCDGLLVLGVPVLCPQPAGSYVTADYFVFSI